MTAALDAVLAAVARDGGPPNVLLMRFLGEAATEHDARAALDRAEATSTGTSQARLAGFAALWAANPQAWATVRAVLAGASHAPAVAGADGELNRWAAVFDKLAVTSPEAGVALYALSNPALLQAATDEVVALARRLGLLGQKVAALDLGCGIGRFCAALAPEVGSVLGLDLSAGMVEAARRRCAGFGNVRIEPTSGRDLDGVPDRSLDLVLAADVMPYLVQAGGGLAAHHVMGFARVLKPGGGALVLNYSYRGDLDADRADLARDAAAAGLVIEVGGTRDLALWDAATFLLRRPVSR